MATIIRVLEVSRNELQQLLQETISHEILQLKELIGSSIHSPPADYNEILTASQAADLLGISKVTLNKIIKSRLLPFITVGKRKRFKRSDLIKYLKTS